MTTGELITQYCRFLDPAEWSNELIADLFPELNSYQRKSLLYYITCRRRRLGVDHACRDHRRLYVKRKK
jgi:hypothetical protein